ncbi:hypothetical protein KCU67_g7663, partial [Aureobasidium melanogenum]
MPHLAKMALQQSSQYRVNHHAQAQYDRLCEKHGLGPTADDVAAIKGVIGPVNTRFTIGGQFEAGLLFFLPKSKVRFEQGALLIGWVQEKHEPKQEVWFKITAGDKGGLYRLPAGSSGSRYYPGGSICHEWHPDILDIVGWDKDAIRLLQYAYLKACIKILQATVPPPSIEGSQPAIHSSASTDSTAIDSTVPDEEVESQRESAAAPIGPTVSPVVDLTGSDSEATTKLEASPRPAYVDHGLTQSTQVEVRIQAFREKLRNKEVEELEQMLEKQLPSWIKKLAEEVLQKKMLEELDLAESMLL